VLGVRWCGLGVSNRHQFVYWLLETEEATGLSKAGGWRKAPAAPAPRLHLHLYLHLAHTPFPFAPC
jgi:hypothetical protein